MHKHRTCHYGVEVFLMIIYFTFTFDLGITIPVCFLNGPYTDRSNGCVKSDVCSGTPILDTFLHECIQMLSNQDAQKMSPVLVILDLWI